jgi:hypothetical protein
MLFGLAFEDGTFPWTIGLMSSLPPFVVAWCAAREAHLLNPYTLFSGAYGAYNGLLLLRFAFLDRGELPYPILLTNESLIVAGLLSAYGSVAIATAWLLFGRKVKQTSPTISHSQLKAYFQVGVAFSVLAFIFLLAQSRQLGGFTQAISIDRVERFKQMDQGFSFPYVSFASISIAIMFLGSTDKRFWRRAAWGAALFWVVVFGLQGDRRLILQILLTSTGVVAVFNPRPFQIRTVTVVIGMAAIFMALVFGIVRPFIALYMQSDEDISQLVLQQGNLAGALDLFMPENTEFGGPYVSVLEATSSDRPLLMGKSYLETIPIFLPRALYPGAKPEALANQLANGLSQGDKFVMGWGYSPVAEAYRNFGVLGVPVIMTCWGVFFLWIWSLQSKASWGIVLSATLLQDAINVNRIDFRTIYLETVFNLAVLTTALLIARQRGRFLEGPRS